MATKFTDIVGRGFAKPIQQELERRKGLAQGLNDTIMYQPYFILRKLKNLSKVLETRKATPEDYSGEPYAKLGKVYDEGTDLDYSFGLNDMINKNTELRGMAGITNVNIELSDFSFYTCTVNFEVNDVTQFRKFKKTWFSFGIPVELEFGRYQPVAMNGSNDIQPNKEKRVGVIVKFDYKKKQDGRGVTGSFKIYSTTWLPVFREGGSDAEAIEKFRSNLKNIFEDYHDIIAENPDFNMEDNLRLFAYMDEDLHDSLYTQKRGIRAQDSAGVGVIRRGNDTSPTSIDLPSPHYIKKIPRGNIGDIQAYILSKFTLDKSLYGSDAYYFVSLKAIEEILEELYSHDSAGLKEINKYFFTDVEVQKYINGTISSLTIEDVLINPFHVRYRKEDGEYIKDGSGDVYLAEDIYISAPAVFKSIRNATGMLTFVENIVGLIKKASGNLIDLQKRIHEVYIDGDAITKGMSFFDNNMISSPDSFTEFEIENPNEKLRNFDITTEIDNDIGNFIFFKSMEGTNVINSEGAQVRASFNDWAFLSPEMLYNYYYRQSEPSSRVSRRKWYQLRRRVVDSDDLKIEYREKARDEIQRRRAEALAEQYKNSYRNFTNTINALKERQSEFINMNGVINNKSYNVALVVYTYYKLYVQEAINYKRQKLEIESDGLRRYPMNVSFDIDGITGILPTQAFKIKFDSFPIQFDINEQSATFVINQLAHSFQSNEWVTNIGGILYISPSDAVKKELRAENIEKQEYTKELRGAYQAKLLELIPDEEETINRLLNIDFGL